MLACEIALIMLRFRVFGSGACSRIPYDTCNYSVIESFGQSLLLMCSRSAQAAQEAVFELARSGKPPLNCNVPYSQEA